MPFQLWLPPRVQIVTSQRRLRYTVVVFTSDNGFFNGEHHIALGKYLMYEPSIRVPMIVRYPKRVPAGKASKEMVLNLGPAKGKDQRGH